MCWVLNEYCRISNGNIKFIPKKLPISWCGTTHMPPKVCGDTLLASDTSCYTVILTTDDKTDRAVPV